MRYAFLIPLLVTALHSAPVFATETRTWRVFDPDSTMTVNHGAWDDLLGRYLTTDSTVGVNLFAYHRVTQSDQEKLERYIGDLTQLDPRSLNQQQQMAYWINLYNALTVNLVLDHYPVDSIKEIGDGWFSFGPWKDRITKVAGESLSLDDIEHKILRPIWQDPRIHYAVNCASFSCPDLASQAYVGSRIDKQLNKAARRYINHPRAISIHQQTVKLSSIYHWYADDFGDDKRALLSHIKQYAEPGLAQQLDLLISGPRSLNLEYHYDWRLNGVKEHL